MGISIRLRTVSQKGDIKIPSDWETIAKSFPGMHGTKKNDLIAFSPACKNGDSKDG